jgi:hypothetical protein
MLLVLSTQPLFANSRMLCTSKQSLVIFFLTSFSLVSAFTDAETTKKNILTTLKQEQPTAIEEFTAFFKKYDDLVLNFFDKKNKSPLKTHIGYMETELEILQKVCHDIRYQSIHPLLSNYHTHLTELITLLKNSIGSNDTLSLSLKIRKFKKILPEEVRKRGNVALFSALHHRLTCK